MDFDWLSNNLLTPVPKYASADGPGPLSGLPPQEAQELIAELAALLDEME